MAKILIVENELAVAETYQKKIRGFGYEVVQNVPTTYSEAWEAVQTHKPDIVLIDIELDSEKDGKDLGLTICKHYHNVAIIYFSQQEKLAHDAWYSTRSIGYVSKNDPDKYLRKEIEEALKEKEQETLTVSYEGRSYQIPIKAILYIEADDNYSNIRVQAHPLLPTCLFRHNLTLNSYEYPTFVRVHRSYLINEQHLVSISNTEIQLAHTELRIPIGRTYKDALAVRLARFIH